MRFTDGVLAFFNYCLCEVGLQYYFWPALSHFHHSDVHIPQSADVIINIVVLPAFAALLTASLGRSRGFSSWPFALGPVAVVGLVFVFGQREFPLSWREAFGIIGLVLVGALAATGAAYSAKYLVHDRETTTSDRTSSAV